MSHDVCWEEGETLTVRVSDSVDYLFRMDRDSEGVARVRIARYDRVTRESVLMKPAYTSSDDDNATEILRQVVRKFTGIDYGCEESGIDYGCEE